MAKLFVLITAGSALCGDVHAELDMTGPHVPLLAHPPIIPAIHDQYRAG